MASLYEILDTARLEYDRSRGHIDPADMGTGPPASIAGWVRPGSSPSGVDNCRDWISGDPNDTGMRATLLGPTSLNTSATQISPWQVGNTGACSNLVRVWCVED